MESSRKESQPLQSSSSSPLTSSRRTMDSIQTSQEWHNLHSKDKSSSNTESSSEEGHHDANHHHCSPSMPPSNPLQSKEYETTTLSSPSRRADDTNSTSSRRGRVTTTNNSSRNSISMGAGSVLVEDPGGRGTLISNTDTRRHDAKRPKTLIDPAEGSIEGVDSASSGGDVACTRRSAAANVSSSGRDSSGSGGGTGTTNSSGDDRDSSGGNGSGSGSGSGSGNSGDNIVTATTTTSSGDDRDSSGGHGSGSGNSAGTLESSGALSGNYHHLHHHHHHRSHHRRHTYERNGAGAVVGGGVVVANDGSTLRLCPRNDTPATVMAARLPALNADGTTTTSSSGSGGEGEALTPQDMFESLLQLNHHKPDYHTIKRTFSKLPSRRGDSKKNCSTDSSAEGAGATRKKAKSKHHGLKPSATAETSSLASKMKNKMSPPCGEDGIITPKAKSARKKAPPLAAPRDRGSPSPESDDSNQDGRGGGSSSGSGTEGGYAASASSNDIGGTQESCTSPSVSSSEESGPTKKSKRHRSSHYGEEMISKRSKPPKLPQSHSRGGYLSSEIADFSSGASDDSFEGGSTINTFTSGSPSLSSSNEGEGLPYDMRLEEMQAMVDQARMLRAAAKRGSKIAKPVPESSLLLTRHRIGPTKADYGRLKDDNMRTSSSSSFPSKWRSKPPILSLGSDIMAHVLTFLEPPNILTVLTMPLSRDWRQNFTCQPELWRVLCLVEPFKAQIDDDDDDDSSSSDSFISLNEENDHSSNKLLGRYRLLYSSFVRCMRYLSQIKDDALNGRAPSFIDYGLAGGGAVANGNSPGGQASVAHSSRSVAAAPVTNSGTASNSSGGGVPQSVIGGNKNLKGFFARARGVVQKSKRKRGSDFEGNSSGGGHGSKDSKGLSHKKKSRKIGKTPKLGKSVLTSRILGPSESGQAGSLNLPWSCAIYSIVNWMVAFPDVEGIQTLCLKVLPFLLEDEQQRMVAQRASLTDVVLRAMVHFPNSVQLHTVAFHAIVLLARPLGGREGMLFHSSMVNASGIFGQDSQNHGGKNGIAVMLDSMQRFEDNDGLQAMSCWSLVNIALAPAQKAVLVKLGGIQATTNAMLRHPHCAEVQFRALFALINLVIPSVRLNANNEVAAEGIPERLEEVNDTSEKEVLDGLVGHITSLVVQAMKHFCSSEAILNRACLVLHNLSLTKDYHTTLLWTPNCYQMIEWCLANYQSDQVLQQSASGTLHRLQLTLSTDIGLRNRFAESIQSQQRDSLEQAHREAIHLHEEHERIQREREANNQVQPQLPSAN